MRRLLMLVAAAPLLYTSRAGMERGPEEILARAAGMVREAAVRIPNYTCVETIERRYFHANLTRTPRDCDDLAAEKKKRGYKSILDRIDRLRLEVGVGPVAERYSWAGANRFDNRELAQIVGDGPAAEGPFGAMLLSVFQGDASEVAFLGEIARGGRSLYQYRFRVPVENSHYYIRTPQGAAITTGFDGTILADAETGELAGLTTSTSELPPEAVVCQLTSALEYGETKIGDASFPLPTEARQRFIQRSGTEVENVVAFSGCRQYEGQSSVSFGSAPEGPAGVVKSAAPPAQLALPAGLPVEIELDGPIDSDGSARGDAFAGTVTKVLIDGGETLIPEGAKVRGRIEKIEIRMQPPGVAIDLCVASVQIAGRELPLRLVGKPPARQAGPRRLKALSALSSGGGRISKPGGASPAAPLEPANLVNSLRFSGTHTVLERGFKTEWLTVSP